MLIQLYLCGIGLEALPASLSAFVLETACLNGLSFWPYVDGTGLIMLLHDTTANFLLLRPRWGARVWFTIRFCMDSPTIIKNLSKACGQFS